MKTSRLLHEKQNARMAELLSQGLTIEQIATRLGVHKRRVSRVKKKLEAQTAGA